MQGKEVFSNLTKDDGAIHATITQHWLPSYYLNPTLQCLSHFHRKLSILFWSSTLRNKLTRGKRKTKPEALLILDNVSMRSISTYGDAVCKAFLMEKRQLKV